MKFDKLKIMGATAVMMAAVGSGAQANTAWYSNSPTIPELQAVIDDTIAGLYTVTLSTTMGTADYLGFGFNWSGGNDDLTINDFDVISAYTPPGSEGAPDTIIPLTDLDIQLFRGVDQTSNSGNQVAGKVTDCGPACNFGGGGSASYFDYILRIGTQGSSGTDYVDEVTFTVASDLGWNPFSQLAARAQTAVDADGNVAGDGGSLKSDLNPCDTPGCGLDNPPPQGVPEISATGSVAALGSVLALMALLLERRGGGSMRRRSVA